MNSSSTYITQQFSNESSEVQSIIKKDQQYLDTIAMIEETQKKNQSTLDTLSQTIKSLQSTLQGVNNTFAQYEKFKDDFGKVLSSLAENFTNSLEKPHSKKPGPGEEDMIPQVKSVQEVANELATKTHIVFLTGAGLSVASGIPTFRGEGGYWTLRNKQEKIKASDFLTHSFFEHTPEEVWRWHHDFRKLQVTKTPNVSHHAIANFQVFCEKQDIKFSLITQNIDDFHVEAYLKATSKPIEVKPKSIATPKATTKVEVKKTTSNMKMLPKKVEMKTNPSKSKVNSTPTTTTIAKKTTVTKSVEENKKPVESKTAEEKKVQEVKSAEIKSSSDTPSNTSRFGIHDKIYEIHGNIKYMRCDKDCTNQLFPSPGIDCVDDLVPKCPNCKDIARPHTLFFDEGYQEVYYRGTTVNKEIYTMDCLIVVGTALETSLASSIVARAISQKKLVIEINPEPSIKYGNVRHLIGGAEAFLPELCRLAQAKMLENQMNSKKNTQECK